MLNLLAAGASIVGGLLNKKSSDNTNKANLKAVNATNDANALLSAKDRAFAAAQVADAQDFDRSQVNQQYKRSQASVADARAYDRSQLVDDRAFNVEQVHDQRNYDADQTLASEARARGYVSEDRDYASGVIADDRSYNSPAATRARLEAAGINPATGMDGSVGMSGVTNFGGGAMSGVPSGAAYSSAAASGVAVASAARSGVASSSSIPMIAPSFQASRFGDSIASATQNYAHAVIEQDAHSEEIALRQTAMAMENERFAQTMARATLSPIVGGPYQRNNNGSALSSSGVSPSNPSGIPVGFAQRIYGDNRDTDRAPVTNLPSLGDVELPSGRTIPALNQELELEGPAAWLNSAWIAGNVVADPFVSVGLPYAKRAGSSLARNRDAIADVVRYTPQRTLSAPERGDSQFYNSFQPIYDVPRGVAELNTYLSRNQ